MGRSGHRGVKGGGPGGALTVIQRSPGFFPAGQGEPPRVCSLGEDTGSPEGGEGGDGLGLVGKGCTAGRQAKGRSGGKAGPLHGHSGTWGTQPDASRGWGCNA